MAEVALDELEALLRPDIADQGEDAGPRPVVRAVEVVGVLQGRGGEVVHRPDRGMGVGVVRREQHVAQGGQGGAVGHGVIALTLLLHDHVPLVVEVLLGQRRQEVTVPVRLEPEGQLQAGARDGLHVGGPVEARGGVGPAAVRHERGHVLPLGHELAPLEHQVLEEVRQAGAARLLVP
ncbi:hypothetical protein BJF80_03770 [Serinicoccus sp. CUA-874]|nr:hypothetical protein BJF80_03770 [Serinicoccus sp. CUA-874]